MHLNKLLALFLSLFLSSCVIFQKQYDLEYYEDPAWRLNKIQSIVLFWKENPTESYVWPEEYSDFPENERIIIENKAFTIFKNSYFNE